MKWIKYILNIIFTLEELHVILMNRGYLYTSNINPGLNFLINLYANSVLPEFFRVLPTINIAGTMIMLLSQ